MKRISVESWFMDKNFTQNEKYAIECARDVQIVKETEKAIFVVWFSEYGEIKKWIPKSLLTIEEITLEEKKEEEKKLAELIEAKIFEEENKKYDYYEKVLNFAKENKIKGVRKYMKLSNIIKKIKENGLEVPAK